MNETPKGLRAHIAIVGRRNAGKSTLLNALAGQKVSIVSSQPGTTTDPVEKTMELKPLGAVVLLDTAGMDDIGDLGEMRAARSLEIVNRSNVAVLVCQNDQWSEAEAAIARLLSDKKIPWLIVRNRFDDQAGELQNAALWKSRNKIAPQIPVIDLNANGVIDKGEISSAIQDLMDVDAEFSGALLSDLVPRRGVCVLVVPIDTGAPKGRLILPQVQAIRDLLDNERLSMVATPEQYARALESLTAPPALVVCDSQVVRFVAQNTPPEIPLTTFSILLARFKGELPVFAAGARSLLSLAPGDSVLIQEACSHYPQPDDIGRVKIPRLLKKMIGADLNIEWHGGKELLNYGKNYKAVIHCGGCVITRAQMAARAMEAARANIPITNYGMTISLAQGVLERVLSPFPEALKAFETGKIK